MKKYLSMLILGILAVCAIRSFQPSKAEAQPFFNPDGARFEFDWGNGEPRFERLTLQIAYQGNTNKDQPMEIRTGDCPCNIAKGYEDAVIRSGASFVSRTRSKNEVEVHWLPGPTPTLTIKGDRDTAVIDLLTITQPKTLACGLRITKK